RRIPAELALDFTGIDRVSAVMSRTIFDEPYEFPRNSPRSRNQFIYQVADQFYNSKVWPFVFAANIVNFTNSPSSQYLPEGAGMILHKEPITNIHSIAVNGNVLAI